MKGIFAKTACCAIGFHILFWAPAVADEYRFDFFGSVAYSADYTGVFNTPSPVPDADKRGRFTERSGFTNAPAYVDGAALSLSIVVDVLNGYIQPPSTDPRDGVTTSSNRNSSGLVGVKSASLTVNNVPFDLTSSSNTTLNTFGMRSSTGADNSSSLTFDGGITNKVLKTNGNYTVTNMNLNFKIIGDLLTKIPQINFGVDNSTMTEAFSLPDLSNLVAQKNGASYNNLLSTKSFGAFNIATTLFDATGKDATFDGTATYPVEYGTVQFNIDSASMVPVFSNTNVSVPSPEAGTGLMMSLIGAGFCFVFRRRPVLASFAQAAA